MFNFNAPFKLKGFANINDYFHLGKYFIDYFHFIFMKAIDRLYQYIDHKGYKPTNFEKEIGLSSGYLSVQRRRSADIGETVVNKINDNCHDISIEWLLTGQGSMLREEKGPEVIVNRLHKPPYREKVSDIDVPLYNIDAAANLRTLFDNKQQNIIDRIKIPDLPKCDGAIYIRGDSMYPLLKAGDIVIYKEIPDFGHLIYGEIYLVDYNVSGEDYLVIKYVKRSQLPNHIQLVSYNPHHDPLDIPVQDCIRAMAIVKASVRLNMMM